MGGGARPVPSNTSALVAFHEHQHFGASIVPRPGMDYPSLDVALSDFDGIGAIDLSIVAQINGGVATSQSALQFAKGRAFTTRIVQNKYLAKLGLVMASTEERKAKPIADLTDQQDLLAAQQRVDGGREGGAEGGPRQVPRQVRGLTRPGVTARGHDACGERGFAF